MGWSDKYKRSIDCDNPKGFSQRAHCQGRKKKMNEQSTPSIRVAEDVAAITFSKFGHKTQHLKGKQHQLDPNLDLKQLVHHATVQYLDRDVDGDVDIFDDPKKQIPDENPQSGPFKAEVGSRKLLAKQKGELKHTRRGMAYEEIMAEEGLRDWYGKSKSKKGEEGWVDVVDGDACAREEGETSTPKCVSSAKRASMSKAERLAAQARKRRNDPNQPKKSGASKPTYVKTDYTPEGDMDLQEVKDKPGKGSGTKDACYHKVKARYDVWPSAYASGALVKCRKVGAANWGNSTNEERDHEYSMARSELSTIISAAKRLRKKMKGEGNIEAWVQSKITKAADYIDAAADYVDSGEMKTEEYSNWRVDFGLSEDWQKVNRQDKTDGLSQKAVDAYRRENPGSKLQTAVTEKKPKGKRAKRRANFCRRMKGMKDKLTSAETARDPDSRINRALRRWNCN